MNQHSASNHGACDFLAMRYGRHVQDLNGQRCRTPWRRILWTVSSCQWLHAAKTAVFGGLCELLMVNSLLAACKQRVWVSAWVTTERVWSEGLLRYDSGRINSRTMSWSEKVATGYLFNRTYSCTVKNYTWIIILYSFIGQLYSVSAPGCYWWGENGGKGEHGERESASL